MSDAFGVEIMYSFIIFLEFFPRKQYFLLLPYISMFSILSLEIFILDKFLLFSTFHWHLLLLFSNRIQRCILLFAWVNSLYFKHETWLKKIHLIPVALTHLNRFRVNVIGYKPMLYGHLVCVCSFRLSIFSLVYIRVLRYMWWHFVSKIKEKRENRLKHSTTCD